MIQATVETRKKQVKSPKGLINGWPLNNTHSRVIVVVTPGKLVAGQLVYLEIRFSADQCNASVCWRGKGKTNVNQKMKTYPTPTSPEATMLVKAPGGCR